MEIKPTSKRTKKIWVKGKEGLRFYKQMKENAKKYTKLLKPKIWYTSEYDMFNIFWGKKPVDQTIELNLLDERDLRFDLTKKGNIVGIEIEDFSKVLKRFDCDKNKDSKKKLKESLKNSKEK